MVLLRLYCIYDSKAEQFSPPQVYHNDMLALRAFEGLVNDDKTLINSYPEDFSLHYVGNLGDSDGRYYIDSSDESRVPLLVGRAVDYVCDLDECPAK
nr:MAG TPA: DNA binding protein [Microviridae sp.]